MDARLLDLLRLANPWLLEPTRFPSAVAARQPAQLLPHEPVGDTAWPVASRAHLLIGARQTGKTTWLWRLFIDRAQAPLFLNGEEPLIRDWAASPTRVAADLVGLLRPNTPVLIDEVQHLDDAGLLIKGLVDSGIPHPIFATGSSAFHLHGRTRESLAGRAVRAEMHGLSLAELDRSLDSSLPPLLREARLGELALRHVVVGGYPDAWLAAEPGPVLRGLVESFVVRDASDLFQVRNLEALRRVMELAARHSGDLVNLSEWASVAGVGRDTVNHYVDLLVESRILQIVRPFAGGKRAELTGRPKVLFRDSGIRNAIVNDLRPLNERADRGAALETWVGGELLKSLSPLAPGDQLHFWRTKSGAEVDFVVRRGEDLEGWEVKATALGRPKLTRSSRSFIDAYEPRRFTVVNLACRAEERVGQTLVRWVTPEALAQETWA